MQTACLEALRFPVADGVSLRLADEARPDTTGNAVELPHGISAILSDRAMTAHQPSDRPPLFYDATAPERGLNALRIFELRDYLWELESVGPLPPVEVTSSLGKDPDSWRPRKQNGRFKFVNFLGAAWIEVAVSGHPPMRIHFEVASPKLDYEQEYRSMIEAIGAECQQLLLEWGTPTTLNLASDPARRAQTLLEQFLFLRHMLGPDRLDLFLEIIQRQPHSRLESEQDWKPAGAADPALFLRDPLRHGRGWHRNSKGVVAEELREERRYDSLDTPPNRFLKFALHDFRHLCDEVLQAKAWPPESPVVKEAEALQSSLDSFLALPLFDDVGELQRIPFESTTLQRREGYREILQAWLMLDAAAQIDWPGRGEAYKGTSRNVATLYEYWLYFVLVRAFRDELKMVPQVDPLKKVDGALPFCCRAENGRLLINLKQREASFCRFRWRPDPASSRELAVHFLYNRSFGRKQIGERGSYSKTFRPDYTLVIIPEEYAGENWHAAERAAETAGRIAYLHFDAKYRGENLPGIFGTAEKEEDEPEGSRDKAAGTAKNADLYKMHTYNEAIRRTVGSYVLYPGSALEPKDANARFLRYHEITPGIGAFALRPSSNGTKPAGLPFVCDFIRDILTQHLTQFSQSFRIDYWRESTVREDRVEYTTGPAGLRLGNRPPKDTQMLLGYVRDDAAALDCRNTQTFFCHAVEWKKNAEGKIIEPRQPDESTDLQFDPFRSDFFVAYQAAKSFGWVAKVEEVKLVSALERANEVQRPVTEMKAAYYYRFQLAEIQEITPRDVSNLVASRPGKPRACRLSEFALCPEISNQQ
jgi:predicted component of viral defense system (DUF524 family)